MMVAHSLPGPIEGASVWYGSQVAENPQTWCFALDDADLVELQQAAERFLDTGADISEIRAAGFALPRLSARLAAWHERLVNGAGFALLRGLPVDEWPRAVSAAAFYGVGAHLGLARPQNAQGHMLGHVIDMGLDAKDPRVRIYQTHARQTFHTDSCDIVGLLCLRKSRRGGESALVSSNTIYNEMRAREPALAAALFDPLATDRRGEVPPGGQPFFSIPVFNWYQGLMSTIYHRQYIDSAQRFDDAFRLTPLHVEALNYFDSLAESPQLHFMMDFEPGDMQFVHNHTMLHDRMSFEDWPEPDRRRHLLRLWLSSPSARPLPPVYAERYGSVRPGERGGVMMPAVRWYAPLEP